MSALKGDVTIVEPTRAQQAIARRVAEARATIPEITVDIELALDRGAGSTEVRPAELVIRACAMALREFPTVNAAYRDGHFELYSRVNIGLTVAGDSSQAIPTILDADRKSVTEIAQESAALRRRVGDGTISPAELAGATFTISVAERVTRIQPIVVAPQAAALGLGGPRPMLALEAGRPIERQVMTAALACDHRIVYGATAAAFLARVSELLCAGA